MDIRPRSPRTRRLTAVLAAVLLGLALSPGRALAAEASGPTAPGTPVVTAASTTSMTLTWAPSTSTIGVASYQVTLQYTDIVDGRNTSTTNSITITGLYRSMTYRINVTAIDVAGNRSPQSPTLIYTLPPGDSVPPSTPGQPVVSDLMPTSLTLTWAPSQENASLYAYRVYRITPGSAPVLLTSVWQHPGGMHSAHLQNLTPGTAYTFAVDAVDDAGNVSGLSPTVSVTTPGGPDVPPPAVCMVKYHVDAEWPGGFQATANIRNLTVATIPFGTLTWKFPNGQTITAAWQVGQWWMDGATASVTGPSWHPTIAPGASVNIGIQGKWTGTNGVPTAFVLNGTGCATA